MRTKTKEARGRLVARVPLAFQRAERVAGIGPVGRSLALLLAFLALLAAGAQAAPQILDPDLQLELWATGLTTPTAIAFLAPGDALVTERDGGFVRRIVDGALQPNPVYELPEGASGNESLVGIAINGETPPAVFLYVEDRTGTNGNRVERHRWTPTTASLDARETIAQVTPSGMAENQDDGGYLLLGPPLNAGDPSQVGDGQTLYVGVGYLQKTGQLRNDPTGTPPDNAGVILRVLQNGDPHPANPFTPYCSATTSLTCGDDGDCPGSETCTSEVELYYAYGVRNVFGMAIDPLTGHLWDQENGEDEYDEVNRVEAGMNSGWIHVMGPHPGSPVTQWDVPGAGSTYSDPEYSWLETTGPTGIAFPYDTNFGREYDPMLLVADFNLPSNIYAFPLDTARESFALADVVAETQAELETFTLATGFTGRAVALEFGPDRDLYIVSHFDGRIYRATGPGRAVPALPVPALLAVGLMAAAGAALRHTARIRRS